MGRFAHSMFLTSLVIAFPSTTMASQLLYDIDFSAPFHQVGNPATSDDGQTPRRGPSRNKFQSPTVVSSYGMMTNGALRFTAPDESPVLSQIELAVEKPLDGVGVNLPEYQLEFDIIIDNLSEEFDRFTVFFDSPRVNTISFRNDGYIRQGFFNRIGTFQEGALLHFDVAFLTDEELMRININGTEFYSGPTQFEATGGLRTIRFSLSDRDTRDSVVYVDNIVVRGVPEPAVAPLLAMMLLACRRRRGRGPR